MTIICGVRLFTIFHAYAYAYAFSISSTSFLFSIFFTSFPFLFSSPYDRPIMNQSPFLF